MSNSTKALKMSYREVPETCPSVEEAFALAEESVKKCTYALRDALVEAIESNLELEEIKVELEKQITSLQSEIEHLNSEIKSLTSEIESLKSDLDLLEVKLYEE